MHSSFEELQEEIAFNNMWSEVMFAAEHDSRRQAALLKQADARCRLPIVGGLWKCYYDRHPEKLVIQNRHAPRILAQMLGGEYKDWD